MKVIKVLNIEDMAAKHAAIYRALERCGVSIIDCADNANDGLDMIEAAIVEGKPYDVVVSDMYFPISKGGIEAQAGMYVIEELQARGIDVPVIVCSSARLPNLPGVVGCIHFNERNDLNSDMRELIEQIRTM